MDGAENKVKQEQETNNFCLYERREENAELLRNMSDKHLQVWSD